MFSPAKQFNKTVWFIIISGFCTGFVSQMAWPFMALILYNKFGLDEFQIGMYLAFAVLVRAVFGFYVGNLSDRIGRRIIILVGYIVGGIGMVVLAWSDNLWVMLGGSSLVTSSWGMIQNPEKALMTDMMEDREAKDLALQLKFFSHNVALAIDPAFGAYIGIAGQQSTFYLSSIVFLAMMIIGLYIFNVEKPLKRTKAGIDQSFKALFSLLAKDHAFLIFIFSYSLIMVAYSLTPLK